MYKIISDNKKQSCPKLKPVNRAIGLGVFDGFHLGHRELVYKLLREGKRKDLLTSVLTFSKKSDNNLQTEKNFNSGLIEPEDKRKEIILKTGIDEIILQDFTYGFSEISPGDFLDKYLYDNLKVRLIVVGFNFRFGKSRLGDVDFIRNWAKKKNVELIVIDPVRYKEENISSSRIRKLLSEGNIPDVNAMLGRKYSLEGTVRSGKKIGRQLGFPTANIEVDNQLALPKNGVYLTKLKTGSRVFESVTNIGFRPSVDKNSQHLTAETLVLGETIDIYGEKICVEFLEFIREEKKFETLELLSGQIMKDVNKAKKRHDESEDFSLISKIGDINIYGVKTKRFSTSALNIRFRNPLTKKTSAVNNLIATVITATCKKYNTRPLLSKKLDSLYGAFIESSSETQGDIHVSSFVADALNISSEGEKPFLETVRLLFDLFKNPDTDNEMYFRDNIVESEKNNMISEIMARKNDKQKYTFDKCLEIYTKGSVFGVRSFGDSDTIKSLTRDDLRTAFYDLINKSEISIYLAGNYDKETVNEILKLTYDVFGSSNNRYKFVPPLAPGSFEKKGSPVVKTEKMDVEQSKICAVYYNPAEYFSVDLSTSNILNTMIGGDVHSLLFQVVREEMGLAYSVFSSSLKYLSATVLMAGVAHDKLEEAQNAMNYQISRIASGDYPQRIFDSSVTSAVYSNKSIKDSIHALIRFYSNNLERGLSINPDAALCRIQTVTRRDVEKLADKLESYAIYRITGDSNGKK